MPEEKPQLPPEFRTPRLRLRPFENGDAPFILNLLNSAGWLRYIGDRNIRNLEDAELYLRAKILRSYEDLGYGLLLVSSLQSGEALGMCGLVKREGLDFPDLGFAFLPEHTGKGYALESARAVLDGAKENLSYEKLQAITLAGNLASIRLLNKLGMYYKGQVNLPDDPETLLLYELNLKS